MGKYSIHDVKFDEFEGLDTKKMILILEETYNKKVSLGLQLKRFINSRWYDRYDYEYIKAQGNKFIAFYSDFYYREDHLKVFNNFIQEFPIFDYVKPIKLLKERLNLLRGFKMLKWDIRNLWRLRKVDMEFRYRIYWVRVLGLIYLYYTNMRKYLDKAAYTFGLVYNDSNPYENILVQLMRGKGIYTATLQHGLFDKGGYWKGIEFRASVADDWLAWNPYSRDLAMKCGISEDKIKILGIPRYIIPIRIDKKSKSGIFSVILGAKVLMKENQELIEFANLLARDYGIKYYLRYHPTCKAEEYDMFVNKEVCIPGGERREEVSQMCEKTDFSLIGSGTSMIIDLIYLNQPFLQYYKQWDGNKYKKRENYFRDYSELKMQMRRKDTLINEEIFYYYCTTRDVKQSYIRYFDSIH